MRLGYFRMPDLRKLHIGETGRRRLLRVGSALLALLLIFFCFYHFTALPNAEIRTMLLTEDTVEETFVGEGVLFRKETVLPARNTGLTVPLVPAGMHVAKDTKVAEVYTGGASSAELYRTVTHYLAALEAAKSEGDVLSDLSALREELDRLSRAAVSELDRGDASAALALSEQIRVLRARVEALSSGDFSLDTLINTLRTEHDAILSSAGSTPETVTVPQSGYYEPYGDGFAELCASEKVADLTGAEFLQISETLRTETGTSAVAGTLVSEPEWFLAVPTELPAEALAALAVGSTLDVIFPENGGVRIPMTLSRTVEGGETTPSLLILSTLRIPSGFVFDRLQTVHVVVGSIGGFSVPSAAVCTLDGFDGVYVLEGNVMYFCRVEVLHDLGVRCLVKTTDPTPGGEFTSNTYRYVALYDLVIVSGAKLFHGRVLS